VAPQPLAHHGSILAYPAPSEQVSADYPCSYRISGSPGNNGDNLFGQH
jgi:hypothetical protein